MEPSGIKPENRIICELCGRTIPQSLESKHHLIPQEYNDKDGSSVILHEVCHQTDTRII
jgi:hypothetical protein